MSPAATRRQMPRRWSRHGLPTVCGVKLADGRECMRRAGPFGTCDDHADPASRPRVPATLGPYWFARYYRARLEEQGREPVLPQDLELFLEWWDGHPEVDGIRVRGCLDLYGVKSWWLVWCRLTGHERLIPFDLVLFCEWWQVT